MISFLKLPSHSGQTIAMKDILKKDIARWIFSIAILLAITYGIGALVSMADQGKYPIGYYAQITLMNTPIAGLVLIFFACILMLGFKKDTRFWSITASTMLIWLIAPAALVHRFDYSGISIAGLAMLIGASLWRIWDYIDIKYVTRLNEPRVTLPVIGAYFLTLIISIILLLPI